MPSNPLATYLSLGTPYQPPEDWRRVPVDTAAYYGPAVPQAALNQLSGRTHSARTAGRLVVKVEDTLRLNPALDIPQLSLIALRNQEELLTLVSN